MIEIMLDLETMGTGPDAAIVAIGAVAFDFQIKEITDEFYAVVSLDSAIAHGGTVDGSTIMWWLSQPEAPRAELATATGAPIKTALADFSEWFDSTDIMPDSNVVWGNGATFDNIILRSAYDRCGLRAPWSTYNDRCYRTAVKMLDPDRTQLERIGTHHNAIDDARSQAQHLMRIWR